MKIFKKALIKILIIAFWLILWQVVVSYLNRDLLLSVPTPISTGKAFWDVAGEWSFWRTALYSLFRVLEGFLLAVAVGTIFGTVSYKLKIVSELFSPILRLMRAIPIVAFIFMLFLWINKEIFPQLIAFFTVLPIIWSTTEKGLCSVDKNLIEMADVLGLPKYKTFKNIVFPGIKPAYSAALITGLGFAWKSAVAAEIMCGTANSLGGKLNENQAAMEYSYVFAVTVVIILFSIVLEGVLKLTLGKGVAK